MITEKLRSGFFAGTTVILGLAMCAGFVWLTGPEKSSEVPEKWRGEYSSTRGYEEVTNAKVRVTVGRDEVTVRWAGESGYSVRVDECEIAKYVVKIREKREGRIASEITISEVAPLTFTILNRAFDSEPLPIERMRQMTP